MFIDRFMNFFFATDVAPVDETIEDLNDYRFAIEDCINSLRTFTRQTPIDRQNVINMIYTIENIYDDFKDYVIENELINTQYREQVRCIQRRFKETYRYMRGYVWDEEI